MSSGVRRTVAGAAVTMLQLLVLGYLFVLRGVLPFGVLLFAFAAPFGVFILRIASRVRRGDDGAELVGDKWDRDDAGLLISRPLATADDLLRKYLVAVDGRQHAELGYGEAVVLPVARPARTPCRRSRVAATRNRRILRWRALPVDGVW